MPGNLRFRRCLGFRFCKSARGFNLGAALTR
jgi:hypothetical protein